MKPNTLLKYLLLTTTLCGLAWSGRADDSAPAPLTGPTGLLGQTYADLTYSYVNLDASSAHGDVYHFGYNNSLRTGLDSVFAYEWMEAGAGAKEQAVSVALRAFRTDRPWGKPYVEAGAGYAWAKVAGVKDNSFVWQVTAGVELQAAPALTVTPYVKYTDAPDLARGSLWHFGAKANYWVDRQWAVTGGLDFDDDQNTAFTLGTSFRF